MKIDNGLFECFNCQKECDETEIKLDKNWRGELIYVCEECCVDIDEMEHQEKQLKNLEPVEDDEF